VNPVQNQAVTAQPNVLSNETIPNTLGGVGPPGTSTGPRGFGLPSVTSIALLFVVIATVAAIAARFG